MKNKRLLTPLAMLTLALVLAILPIMSACAEPEPAPAPAEPVTLVFQGNVPVGHQLMEQELKWVELVEERSDGLIKVLPYLSGELYTSQDIVRVLPTGVVQLACISSDAIASLASTLLISELPGLWDSFEQSSRVLHEDELWDILDEELQANNMKLIGFFPYSTMPGPITTVPVHTLADIQGLKIRSPGGNTPKIVEGWGAAPVMMSTAEVYTAIQRGTIDGAMTGWGSIYGRSWGEVAKYVLDMPVVTWMFPFIMHLPAWNDLSEDLQDMLMDTAYEVEVPALDIAAAADGTDRQGLIDQGVEMYTPTGAELAEWQVAMKAVADEWGEEEPNHAEALRIAEEAK